MTRRGSDDGTTAARLRLRLHITGRVQGVWYRGATEREARQLGVDGWVRNLPDGSVEALVEGAPGAVRTLADWCRTGPPGARVRAVVETPEPAGPDLAGFRIRS
ncbi:MAG: acylphosphatase [Deltaproteobacteria bacterium]|nr:acylphosphatase [Deltaproteobacteria bacterium]